MGFCGGSGDGEDPGWEGSPGVSEIWKPGVDLKSPGVQECSEFGREGDLGSAEDLEVLVLWV